MKMNLNCHLNDSFDNISLRASSTLFNTADGTGSLNLSTVFPWLTSRLRIFLYLSNPYEESFQFPEQVVDYHTETTPLLFTFVILEWFILFIKGKPLPLLGDSFASTSMIVIMECARILTRGVEHTAYIYIYDNYRLVDLPWQSPFTWYIAALFVDFCYYWGHRISHECNLLWSQHQAHHSAETYSLVNTFRLPFTQSWLYSFAYLPMALVVSPAHYLVHLQLNLLYQFWLHTEIFGKLGPLEWILNTPSHHRVHHGSNKFCLDKNYGAWLIIWDRMFGTFQEEKEDEEIIYGLVDQQVESFNPLYLQLFYFRKVFDKLCSMDGWKNKILSLIKGPGWRPGSPWTGYIEEVPDIKERKKFTYGKVPSWFSLYMLIHSFITLLAYESANIFRDRMSSMELFCHLMYIVYSSTTTGLLYNKNQLAPFFEFVRCSFVFFYSQNGLLVVNNVLTWAESVGLIDERLLVEHSNFILMVVQLFFFFSAFLWGLISTHKKTAYSWQKTKRIIKCD